MTRRTLLIIATAFGLAVILGSAAIWRWHPWTIQSVPEQRAAAQPPAPAMPQSVSRGGVSIDPRRQQLINVRTVKAARANLGNAIHAVGAVRSDEARVIDVNVKLEGWIRDMSVDYTGRAVRRGEPLLTLYSPELLAAEHEYTLALTARDAMQASVIADAKQRADTLVSAARQRLALWDLSDEEFRDLETTRRPKDTLVVRSPANGFVIDKPAVNGAHVTPGQTLYKIVDLSVVWIEADVYQTELASVHVGDRAKVTLETYPGEPITGRVVYIYPYLEEQTRTNKIRYEFANSRGRLKPGMFVTVDLATSAGTGVVVPTDAVLDSGREQLVFVAEGNGYFAPRSVTVGRRLAGSLEIRQGLKEGEEVATGATFFVDSESQLRAGVQGYAPTTPAAAASTAERLHIALKSIPDPAKTGENQFEVTVADDHGVLIPDADVSLQFFMPAMPAMNMPAMRNQVALAAAGGGVYRGTGQVMMAGRWEVTVVVSRAGQPLGSIQTTLVAR
jgi:Cu(I)/Ag(I) efflux system membrane fusion protein